MSIYQPTELQVMVVCALCGKAHTVTGPPLYPTAAQVVLTVNPCSNHIKQAFLNGQTVGYTSGFNDGRNASALTLARQIEEEEERTMLEAQDPDPDPEKEREIDLDDEIEEEEEDEEEDDGDGDDDDEGSTD